MKKESKHSTLIIILSILLILSLLILAGLLLPGGGSVLSVKIPDNVIMPGEQSEEIDNISYAPYLVATTSGVIRDSSSAGSKKSDPVQLKLYRYHADDNEPFQVENMFPGDVVTKEFCVRVTYSGKITVKFHADIDKYPSYQKLAEVLQCRVTDPGSGAVFYDGLMRDMPSSVDTILYSAQKTSTDLRYEVTAYLDTSVGNEYQFKSLKADFKWWAEGCRKDKDTDKEKKQDDEEKEDEQEEGQLEPAPNTGLLGAVLTYWWIPVSAAFVLIFVLLLKKRSKEKRHE